MKKVNPKTYKDPIHWTPHWLSDDWVIFEAEFGETSLGFNCDHGCQTVRYSGPTKLDPKVRYDLTAESYSDIIDGNFEGYCKHFKSIPDEVMMIFSLRATKL